MSYKFGATTNKFIKGNMNIPKGTHVLIKDDNYIKCHQEHIFCKIKKNTFTDILQENLDFDIPKKLYIISNSVDGKADIKGEYALIDECGVIVYQQICSAKKFAKKDLIIGHTERLKECSKIYGGNYKILYLGEDDMTAQKLLDAHGDYYYSDN